MAKLLWAALLVSSVAVAAQLTSSTLQVSTDERGHEVFSYTCVYANGVVLQNMPNCPPSD